MPSLSARSGLFRTSTISSLKRPCRYSLQISARLATARTEFGASRATYRHMITIVLRAILAAVALRGIGITLAAQLFLALARGEEAGVVLAGEQGELGALALQIVLHRLDAGAGVGFAHLQLAALVVEGGTPLQALAALLVLLFPAQRSHQHFAAGGIDVGENRASGPQDQLAYLVGVPGPAELIDGGARLPSPLGNP